MPRPEKEASVRELQERLRRASITVGADFRGVRVRDMTELRRRLRGAGLEVKVVKNSLLRLAAQGADQTDLMEIVEGPTVLLFGYEDNIAAARAIIEYSQGAPAGFAIRGAFLDGTVVSNADLRQLVNLPPRPVLVARIMGQLQSPLITTLTLLEAPLQELLSLLRSALSQLPSLLEARARQLEQESN